MEGRKGGKKFSWVIARRVQVWVPKGVVERQGLDGMGKREDTFVSYFSVTLPHPSRFIRYGSWATVYLC